MKKTILFFSFSIFACLSAFAQPSCTPEMGYDTAQFGIWPDTTKNLPCSQPGNTGYTTTVHFKVPDNAQDIDPNYPNATITSVTLDAVNGLPTGVAYFADQPSWNANTMGCVLLTGDVGASAAVYDITMTVTAYLGIISQQETFGGYHIVVSNQCWPQGVSSNDQTYLHLMQNAPNPATGYTQISFMSELNDAAQLNVYNMLGEVVLTERVAATMGNNSILLNLEDLSEGIYTYALTLNGHTLTKKMIVRK